jgi:hypothetical protein
VSASLLLLVTLTLFLVIIAANRPQVLADVPAPGFFPSWIAGPLRGLWPRLNPSQLTLEYLVSGVMVAMFGCYLVALRYAPRLRARWTLAAIAALHVVLFMSPPLRLTDVFNYINYGHMAAVDHLNPYTTIPLLAPHGDLSFALSNWHGLLSPYGPLFTQFTEALVPLGMPGSLWTLKVVDGLADLATLVLVWRCAERLGRPPAAAAAFAGLNPLVLVWGLGAVHYDSLMMFFVVGAAYLLVRARSDELARPRTARSLEMTAGAGLAVAIVLKPSAAILLPIFLLSGRRRHVLYGLTATAIVLALASVASFGLQFPDLGTQSSLVNTRALPDVLGYLVGLGGETHAMHSVLSVGLVVSVAVCGAWAWRSPNDWLTAAGTLMALLVVTLSWSVPWYVLWILPFAALSRRAPLRVATLALSVYFLVSFMPARRDLAQHVGFLPESTSIGRAAGRAVQALGG